MLKLNSMANRPRHIKHGSRSLVKKSKKEASRSTSKALQPERQSASEPKRKNAVDIQSQPISPVRLWVFRLVSIVLLPLLLFGLLEVVLRIAAYGFPTTSIIERQINGTKYYCDNVKFAWQFFPRNIARELDPFIFPLNKSDNTYRVFILGGSAAFGTPDPSYGFWRILKVLLEDEYPDTNFEVVPMAMPAINSHVVLKIAKDCARLKPDLFIVYLGNNEVIGPYGAGTVFSSISSNLSLIRAGIAFKGMRLSQLLSNVLESTIAGRGRPDVWRGLEMFLDKQVRANDDALQDVYSHFFQNLEDIARVGCKAKAKVIFCTVASNLKDCPPFASLHRSDLTEAQKQLWDGIYKQGVEYERARNYRQAIERYLAAVKIDDSYADLQFRLGRCYWDVNDYDAARDRYLKARQMDTLRFRADSRINEIIREVAGGREAEGVYLVDAVKAFEKNSPHGLVGAELLYEHVHMNFSGNYLLARTILEKTEQMLPKWIMSRKAQQRSMLTEAQCAQRLVYNDWVRYNLASSVLNANLKQPPFTNQLYHDEQLKALEKDLTVLKSSLVKLQSLEAIAGQYHRAIGDQPSDWRLHWNYALLLSEDFKDNAAAAEQYRMVMKLLPHSYRPHLALAVELSSLNQLDEAKEQLMKALRIKPTSAIAYHYLGLIHQKQGRLDEATKCYWTAVRLQPNYVEAYNTLAGCLSEQGKVDQAIQVCRKALLFAPKDMDLRYNLALLLRRQGRADEAVRELRAALQVDPNSAKCRKMLDALQGGLHGRVGEGR
jgi:tetratricopeptide (TPR) repeat protein